MGYSTVSVAAATTPSVFKTFFSHFLLHRKSRKGSAKEELSYDEGLAIIRKFLEFASKHTIEELQNFTKQKVPVPNWVFCRAIQVPDDLLDQAANILRRQLSADSGLQQVGGSRWWTVRDTLLQAEWIEMEKDKLKRINRRKQSQEAGTPMEPDRILLYIHGGAYMFSSIETHRYQIQRHARKLNARAFAPSYRLAPQYPFPCGLQDCLAAYLYLLYKCDIPPSSIIISGDSAGAGMALALLCILRDQDIPLPAGASLISPWVDLTHSFPSIMRVDASDYIPADGFHFKPSQSWPPLREEPVSVDVNGAQILVKDQIQLYCSNHLISHPLVSPVNQGSLGGLPPISIIGGGAELLGDEMIYIAHKAANPEKYRPCEAILTAYPSQRSKVSQYPPTAVDLKIWDDCAHVIPTLSFTKPAKFMYRAAANFNLWALSAAQQKAARHERRAQITKQQSTYRDPSRSSTLDSARVDHEAANIEGLPEDYDPESENSSDSDESCESDPGDPDMLITVTGTEPHFHRHMIRERVDLKGYRRPMEDETELAALNVAPEYIGTITSRGPIQRWLTRRAEWDAKYQSQLTDFRKSKEADLANARVRGYLTRDLFDEQPPLCSLVSWYSIETAKRCADAQDVTQAKSGMAMSLWAKLSAMPDEAEAGNKKVQELADRLAASEFPISGTLSKTLVEKSEAKTEAMLKKLANNHEPARSHEREEAKDLEDSL